MGIYIYVNYFSDQDPDRRDEYLYCLSRNQELEFINKIFVFLEQDQDRDDINNDHNLEFITLDRRMEFRDCIDHAQNHLPADSVIVIMNLDTFLEDSPEWRNIEQEFFEAGPPDVDRAMVIKRHNLTADMQPMIEEKHWEMGGFCDAWVLRTPFRPRFLVQDFDFCVGGAPACDNVMMWLMTLHYHTYSWGGKYKLYHLDLCRKKDGIQMITNEKTDWRPQKRTTEYGFIPAFQDWDRLLESGERPRAIARRRKGTTYMKRVLVCGAGGFIGGHLVTSLKQQGYYVIGADIKEHEYKTTDADEFHLMDLREQVNVRKLLTPDIDTIYQLAADMGGAGYIFTGENDANIMHNSAMINLNIAEEMVYKGIKNVFYTSSACMYPSHNQEDPDNPLLSEESAYPANPDSEYGWEKLFSERLYMSFARNHGIRARIARLHNIFGPLGSWNNGKEKAPAALCRKVAESDGHIEVWGPGQQTRSFLYIDECIEGIHKIQASDCEFPLNLGSERMISINNLARLIAEIAGKTIEIRNVPGPMGVMGRNSHNRLIRETIGWAPGDLLEHGLRETYAWISSQVNQSQR